MSKWKCVIVGLALLVLAGAWGDMAVAQDFSALQNEPGAAPGGKMTEEELINQDFQTRMQEVKGQRLSQEAEDTYTLGKTDVLEIAVMRHPEVSGLYVINSDGKIQYEFVGDVKVADLTKGQVSELITEKLKDYIINPEVTVKIAEYNSKVVFVVGEVYNPGKIFMRGNTITIREALLEAGLPMLTGVTKKSRLITPDDTGKAFKKDVNVYALLYEGDLRENLVMQPGDVLYIPPTFLTKTMRALQPVAAPIGTAAGTGRTVATGF